MTGTRKGIKLTERQRLFWLQLIRSENVGPQTFRQLIEHYGSAENALEALPALASNGGKRTIRVAKREDAEAELEYATRNDVRFIGIGEPDYPGLLRQIDAPPPLLAVKGNIATLNRTSIGIVGSRDASAVGMRLAATFARDLGNAGLVTISGFARGIDAHAHKASLESGTIAVMAGGIEQIYPPENRSLYDEILERNGAIISEMPMGWEPRARDFPRRNRLIAGISLGLLVVEAAKRSGSLITARLAADCGRLVFAVPGSPLDPRSSGTNGLIKDGANLADCAQDIIETLTPLVPEIEPIQKLLFCEDINSDAQSSFLTKEMQQSVFVAKSMFHIEIRKTATDSENGDNNDLTHAERERLLACLSEIPVDLETLSIAAALPIPRLYLAIMELDLAGRILRHSGGLVSLALP